MGFVAGLALCRGLVDRFGDQHLARMAPQTVIVGRLDARMGLVAFIAIQSRHGDFVGERCF